MRQRYGTATDTEGMLPHNKSGVRRQSEASTALWMSLRDSDCESQLWSRYACQGTPKTSGRGFVSFARFTGSDHFHRRSVGVAHGYCISRLQRENRALPQLGYCPFAEPTQVRPADASYQLSLRGLLIRRLRLF